MLHLIMNTLYIPVVRLSITVRARMQHLDGRRDGLGRICPGCRQVRARICRPAFSRARKTRRDFAARAHIATAEPTRRGALAPCPPTTKTGPRGEIRSGSDAAPRRRCFPCRPSETALLRSARAAYCSRGAPLHRVPAPDRPAPRTGKSLCVATRVPTGANGPGHPSGSFAHKASMLKKQREN